MTFQNEYLLVIDRSENNPLKLACTAPEDLTRILQTDDDIKIVGSSLTFAGNQSCTLSVSSDDVEGQNQRFFFVVLRYDADDGNVENFAPIVRAFKRVARQIGEVETLRDDISKHYCQLSYPMIFDVENLMRKLISYFMLTRVGTKWVFESSPSDIQKTVKERAGGNRSDERLHDLDFIQLGDILFKSSQSKPVSLLYEMIQESADADSTISANTLRDFVPRSNWEKYFKSFVDSDGEYIERRWKELYDLRNRVAHNTIIHRTEYERIRDLSNEVSVKLAKAIEVISEINVPEADKERIHEQVASNSNELIGEFIRAWHVFESAVINFAENFFQDDPDMLGVVKYSSIIRMVEYLAGEKAIDEETLALVKEVQRFRNEIVHGSSILLDSEDSPLLLAEYIRTVRVLTETFDLKPNIETWKDEVVKALKQLGGEALLKEIYDEIIDTTDRKLSRTWRSSVRRTLQAYSSDCTNFLNGDDLFEHLGTGRWGLRSQASF